MSMEFSVVFSAPNTFNLAQTLFNISKRLKLLDFHHERDVHFIDFDNMDDERPPLLFDDFMNGEGADWDMCSIRFNGAVWLVIFLDRRRSDFLNIYIETSFNTIMNNHRHGHFPAYLAALIEIARATQAVVGCGDTDMMQEKVSYDDLAKCILNNPDKDDYPADLGIVKSSAINKDVVKTWFSEAFHIEERDDYWLLVGKNIMEYANHKD